MIGEVTETGRLRAFHGGELVGDIPVETLTDEAPRYDVEQVRPARLVEASGAGEDPATPPDAALRALLAAPGTASRCWVTRQYDQLVGSGTVVRPGGDAAVVRLTPSKPRDRRLARRQRPPHPARSPPRRDERGVRGRPQRGVHRRATGRGHQLPELRQPRGRPRSATSWPRRSGAWPTPAAPWRCRSSRATSRSTTSMAAARSRRRRSSASSAYWTTPSSRCGRRSATRTTSS